MGPWQLCMVCWFVPYFILRSKLKIGKKGRRDAARKLFKNAIESAKQGSIALDCGANQGLISEKFLAKGMRVHAFEPDPVAQGILLEKLNGQSNLNFMPVAVGVENSRVTLYRRKQFAENPAHWTMSSSLLKRKVCDGLNTEYVEVTNLLDYIRNLDEQISILKMDIEGSEIPILEQLLATGLHRKIDLIFVETHERISFYCAIRTAVIRAKIHVMELRNFNLDHN